MKFANFALLDPMPSNGRIQMGKSQEDESLNGSWDQDPLLILVLTVVVLQLLTEGNRGTNMSVSL